MSKTQAPHGSVAACADALRPFVCTRTEGGRDAAWVHLAGELDIATTPRLALTLHEALMQARLVVLDLRELAFMDASGLRAIVHASVRARQAGRRLILIRGPLNIDCLFSLTGYADQVEIGDLDPAEPPFSPRQRLLVPESLLAQGA